MNAPAFLFEFHDSEVSEVRAEGPDLLLRFSAASVRQASDGAAGHVRSLLMRLAGAEADGPLHEGVGRLAAGELFAGGSRIAPVPLPFAAEGAVHVSLRFNNGTQLSVRAIAVALRFGGDPRFMESYAC